MSRSFLQRWRGQGDIVSGGENSGSNGSKGIEQFSVGCDFYIFFPPKGHLEISGDILIFASWGWERTCYWHLMGRVQECYQTKLLGL